MLTPYYCEALNPGVGTKKLGDESNACSTAMTLRRLRCSRAQGMQISGEATLLGGESNLSPSLP